MTNQPLDQGFRAASARQQSDWGLILQNAATTVLVVAAYLSADLAFPMLIAPHLAIRISISYPNSAGVATPFQVL
ncbi:hypothetical protein [Brucella pseudogrignonensis]|jgi:hypothetical protein|uniref:hypothetical protein n=1 Tax=Brucella pseudogrignonensis TaxID=419475 RepID=UPI001A920286|nr:hypothetical protein [Brucella pseudogrignonensis]